ncbi:HAD family hydrolase [Sneathiella sp. HT1-7]|uniref:HAD family hydrolase n=1 Tax=Sneathiella sp. HT1-7 TaxID=2887192 RepID=UPI001D13CB80|nr:HAD-IA family hydrolase [Sneathiella sp. HT1-7]MCC3303982.1 HAD-IA family hydrolase [Sneathiella sp. HT1-7]
MARPDLIIFDCDGVLVDTEPTSNAVLAENLTRHGLSLSAEECTALFTGWSMVNVEKEAKKLGASLPEGWIKEVYAEEFAALKQGVPAMAGIHDILDRLDAIRLPFCVASNGSEEKMAITLGQTGLLPRFEGAMFSAHTLKTSKPDPALFQAALAAFKVEPARAVVIEDSVLGSTGAARADIPCYGFAPHHNGADLAATGAKVFKDMCELVELLKI